MAKEKKKNHQLEKKNTKSKIKHNLYLYIYMFNTISNKINLICIYIVIYLCN